MQEIGEWLRIEREAKGLSRAQLEQTTTISARYIAAMEDGEFGIIPDNVYRRAFIRTYARGVGIDPEPIVSRFSELQGSGGQGEAKTTTSDAPGSPVLRFLRLLVSAFNGTMEWMGM